MTRRNVTGCVKCGGDKQGQRSSYCIPCMDNLIHAEWFKDAMRKVKG